MKIRRGTTPTVTVEIPEEINLLTEGVVTIKQFDKTIERTLEDMDYKAHVFSFVLSQDETLGLSSLQAAQIQIRLKDENGTAFASQIEKITVLPVDKEGVI